MGWFSGLLVAMALTGTPEPSNASLAFNPQICQKKRVDACGCHHVYGIRHCHPNRKSPHCEAPVKAAAPAPKAPDVAL